MSERPARFDPAQLVTAATRAAEIVARFYGSLDDRPVAPEAEPAALARQFANTIHDEGTGVDALLAEFESDVLPHCMSTPHPLYLGLVNSSPLPAAFTGDYLVSALNNNNGAWQQSPAFTAAEGELLRVFRELTGYPADSGGMVLPGGTAATLQALILARDAKLPAWRREGPGALDGAPRIYTADVSHFSIARSAHAIGVGDRGVVEVPSIGRGEIDVDALEERVARDIAAGDLPFAVVASIGTTGTGAIDPVGPLLELCREHDLWLHVDACYGGAALLLDDLRERMRAIAAANSIVIDAHKWFFVPITAGVLLTRDADLDVRVFDTPASYIPSGDGVDAYRRGFPTSRRCSAFTAWFALRAHGLGAVRDAVVRNIELTRRIERELNARGFRVLEGGELSIACARCEPAGLDGDATDRLQEAIAARVVRDGTAWFATVRHDGKTWLRFNMVNIHTRDRHVDRLVEAVCSAADDCQSA